MIISYLTGKQNKFENKYCIKHTKFNVIIVRCGKIFHDLIVSKMDWIIFKAIVLFLMFECTQSFKSLGFVFILFKYSKNLLQIKTYYLWNIITN